jgi:hypothetical protein
LYTVDPVAISTALKPAALFPTRCLDRFLDFLFRAHPFMRFNASEL